jgi:hypothetical protein
MNKKQIYRTTISFEVEIEADDLDKADEQVNTLINQLTTAKTDLVWDCVNWDHEPTIDYDTDYSGNLPKDEV